jgi:hypothetical protein
MPPPNHITRTCHRCGCTYQLVPGRANRTYCDTCRKDPETTESFKGKQRRKQRANLMYNPFNLLP